MDEARAAKMREWLFVVAERAQVLIASMEPDGRLIYLNAAGRRMLGWGEDLSGRRAVEMHPERAAHALLLEGLPAATARGAWETQTTLLGAGGVEVSVAQVLFAHRGADGAVEGFSTLIRDATQQRLISESLRHSNQLMRFVMDALPNAVFWKDRGSVYLGCNESFARVAGVTSPEEIVGKTDHELAWKPEEAQFFIDTDQRVMGADEPVYNIIEPQLQASGKQAWLQTSKAPLHDASGRVIGIMGCFEDITERQERQERLERSEARYRLLAENAADLIFVCGPLEARLPLRYINPAVEAVLGYDAEALIARPLIDYVCEGSRLTLNLEVQALIEAGEGAPFRLSLRHAEGHLVECEVSARPVYDEEGQVTALQGRITDLTERLAAERQRRRLEEQLRHSQKMDAVGRLAGGIAHDFNNLLTAILGHLELSKEAVREALGEKHELAASLGEIERAALSASSLTRQLLTFSRRDVQKPRLVDLNGLLRNLERMLGRLVTENIEVSTALAPALHAVRADPGHLEQVIVNLVVNAVHAMPTGGRLTLETQGLVLDEAYVTGQANARLGPHVMLAVSDTGHGMEPAVMERIFEPFFTTKYRDKGTGLGLATVHGIVEEMGGHISVYSEPRVGSTFKVLLPAAEGAAAPEREAQPEGQLPGGSETIILCEDDGAVRALCELLLSAAGYAVLAASTGAEAVALAEAHEGRLDLLISDVILPDTNGWALARQLAQGAPQLPTLFISGYTSRIIAHHGVLGAGVRFLEKPFTRRALLVKARAALDGAPDA